MSRGSTNAESKTKGFMSDTNDYDQWTSDNYLYEYINTDIIKIFNN